MCFDTQKSELQPESINGIILRKDSSKHNPEEKSRLKKNLSRSKDHSFLLKSKRNHEFAFWTPRFSNHWEGSLNFKQLFILYGLWPWKLSAILWLYLLEQKVYFTAGNKLSFLCALPQPSKGWMAWHVREKMQTPMTNTWGEEGKVANRYGNFYAHTSERQALYSFPSSSHIPWLRVGGQAKRTCFHCFTFLLNL